MYKHIVYVNDAKQIQSNIQVAQEGDTYVVNTARDGLISLDKIEHQQAMPEFIMLDLNLPRMNGLQLIEVLRQREEVWLDSIIVLSADRDGLKQARTLGIRRCLAKPFDLEKLLELISTPVV